MNMGGDERGEREDATNTKTIRDHIKGGNPRSVRTLHTMATNAASPGSQYNKTDEVVWFISVTKESTWEKSRFDHEFHVVHAGMVRQRAAEQPALRGYTQIRDLEFQHLMPGQPDWDCVARLAWESLFTIWADFQDPNYVESAGKHHFCRLDEVGALVKEVGSFDVQPAGNTEVRVLVFHKKESVREDASESWLQDRLGSAKTTFAGQAKLQTYRLLVDVAPKDLDFFFKDTQFAPGTWNLFLAVEEFVFTGSKADARKFVDTHRGFIEKSPKAPPPQIVIGEDIKVV